MGHHGFLTPSLVIIRVFDGELDVLVSSSWIFGFFFISENPFFFVSHQLEGIGLCTMI